MSWQVGSMTTRYLYNLTDYQLSMLMCVTCFRHSVKNDTTTKRRAKRTAAWTHKHTHTHTMTHDVVLPPPSSQPPSSLPLDEFSCLGGFLNPGDPFIYLAQDFLSCSCTLLFRHFCLHVSFSLNENRSPHQRFSLQSCSSSTTLHPNWFFSFSAGQASSAVWAHAMRPEGRRTHGPGRGYNGRAKLVLPISSHELEGTKQNEMKKGEGKTRKHKLSQRLQWRRNTRKQDEDGSGYDSGWPR